MSPNGTMTPFHSGALATNLRESALAARAAGVEALIVVRRSPHPPYEDVNALFVDYPRVESGLPKLAARIERKLFDRPQYGHHLYAHRVAGTLRKNDLQSVPWIISNDPALAVFLRSKFPRAFIIHRFHNQMKASDFVRARLAQSVNGSLAVSDFTRDWIEDYYNFAPGVVKTVYNGVNAEMFAPAASPPPGPPVVNFVGRTGIEKAVDLLYDAAIELASDLQKTPFSLQIVGTNTWKDRWLDDYQRTLIERVEKLEKMGVAVRQTGHVNRLEVPAEFQKAHIHVVPSRWDEPFGLTTVEGMASGLAVVASKTGGTPEIVGDHGWLFERENAADLAQKLRPLLQNEDLRREYGQKARARALEFSWQNTWRGLSEAAGL